MCSAGSRERLALPATKTLRLSGIWFLLMVAEKLKLRPEVWLTTQSAALIVWNVYMVEMAEYVQA
jgi:hypothetical protein